MRWRYGEQLPATGAGGKCSPAAFAQNFSSSPDVILLNVCLTDGLIGPYSWSWMKDSREVNNR
ncbi:hypothetical protein CSKR_202487 [Clonorchis sinensis]|uniref:Uncharacterized protein n=1 Tax=Clonorchis sinensis TaxID=79923 RepID=A0A8T1MX75_CLOSI|nr:hypothetical protein CSKR_202487 [Clonorchis sinensis]